MRFDDHFEQQVALAKRFTARAERLDGQPSWPFVQLEDFSLQSSSYASTAQAVFLPFLRGEEQVADWKDFSMQNNPEAERHAIYNYFNGDFPQEKGDEFRLVVPYWQISPDKPSLVNYNAMNQSWFPGVLSEVLASKKSLVLPYRNEHRPPHQQLDEKMSPRGLSITPVWQKMNKNETVAGLIMDSLMPWDSFFLNNIQLNLPGNEDVSMTCVLQCGEDDFATYQLFGRGEAVLVGEEDLHDTSYDSLASVFEHTVKGCTWNIYPTRELAQQYKTKIPTYITLAVCFAFGMMLFFFLIYEGFVQRKNSKIISAAAQFNKVVSSLFPSNLRNRILGDASENAEASGDGSKKKKKRSEKRPKKKRRGGRREKTSLKAYLYGEQEDGSEIEDGSRVQDEIDHLIYKNKPLADLYTDTTILFADIVGFSKSSRALKCGFAE